MTVAELRKKAADNLGIHSFNAMQNAMAEQKLPARLLLLAPTGSGKTLAFAIPFLSSLRSAGRGVQAVVIAPTRELVLQIFEIVRTLAAPAYKTAAFYGGHDMRAEVATLSGNPDVIVATPGRLLDHIQRGHIDLQQVRSLVLDEYDKSLELGFYEEMRKIFARLNRISTFILTSATSAAQLPDFVDGSGFKTLDFCKGEAVSPDLEVVKIPTPCKDKLDTLCDLLQGLRDTLTLVFVNHREAAERVYGALCAKGYPAGVYHGALEQAMRERALILFENGTTPILAATDLAARGLDIDRVGAVVHYHLPISEENWTHRNGRTGRQGAKGQIYAIISEGEKVPEYISFATTREAGDVGTVESLAPVSTLYINAGRRDKISRGDVAGFILRNTNLPAEALGRIDLRDHCAYAALPADKVRAVVEMLKPLKLKNKRVRVSIIEN